MLCPCVVLGVSHFHHVLFTLHQGWREPFEKETKLSISKNLDSDFYFDFVSVQCSFTLQRSLSNTYCSNHFNLSCELIIVYSSI
ncbi:unnamed protein product [Meloidogyne enterolobii]|uniref:Uncharacterized protein n=1 Tax=Meloidogyne enterolobii TaxID=390850 RepID=A0ACB0XRF6_MELEN